MAHTSYLQLPLNLSGHAAMAQALEDGFRKIADELEIDLTVEGWGHVPPQQTVLRNFAIIEQELGIQLPKTVSGHVGLQHAVEYAFKLIDYTLDPANILESIAIDQEAPTLEPEDTLQLTVTGTFADESERPVTTGLTWASSDEEAVIVSSTGLVTAVADGTSTITVSLGELTDTLLVTVETVETGEPEEP